MTGRPSIITVSGAATDVGRRRALNEDAALASAPCFLVADGMGGHDAGDVASGTAIAAFQAFAGRPWLTVDQVRDAIDGARDALERYSAGRGGGAGTTLSGVVLAEVHGEGYWLALNVGDSRTYRLQRGRLTQLTVDHSLVQELVDAGELTADEARSDRRRNVVTRALGAGSWGLADMWMLPARRGDRILVCSDGLSEELPDERIQTILRVETNPQAAASRLVHEAVLQGGRDNVTAVVVDAEQVMHGARWDPVGDDDIDVQTIERTSWIEADTVPQRTVLQAGA